MPINPDIISASLGALGSLGSAGIGAISANHMSGKAFDRAIDLMKLQAKYNYDYSLKSAENLPSSTRKGLINAGYNPMLAVQNATSGANSNWTSSGGYQQDQATDAITNGIRNGTEMAQLAINQQQVDAQSDQAYAEADKAKVEKNAMLQKMPFISSREKAEIANIEKDSLLKESQIHNIDETTRFIEKEYELRKRLGEMGIDVQRYGIDKNFAGIVYNADTLFDIANEHQPSGRSSSFKNYAGGARDIMSGIGDILHGRNDTYENYDESVQHSSRDKKTGVTTTTKSRRTGRRKK